jgi:hypothetical protein
MKVLFILNLVERLECFEKAHGTNFAIKNIINSNEEINKTPFSEKMK